MNAEQFHSQFRRACLRGFRPDPDLTVTQWADHYRILPKKSSSEPGRYRSARTPYAREIMDALSTLSPVSEICVMKGTQLGFTELGNNWFGYVVDITPGPMMMVFPTLDLARDHSKQKMQPTINETPRLKDKIREARTRDSGNTIDTKEFPGGIIFLSGSNSGAFFRSKSIRFLFLDDVDGFDLDVGGEGDPAELARKRTDSYGRRKKILEVSTPTTKGISRIERSFYESDQRYYEVPCPHCGIYQRLEWGGEGAEHGLKFKRGETGRVVDVWYQCRVCHERIEEYHKTDMLERGRWVPTHPEHEKRGYQISSLYSPLGWVSWKQIVEEFLEAKAYKERLKTWVNTRLGEAFEETGEQPEWNILQARCEPYKILTVPRRALLLTAGVDTQDNRLAVLIKAWGRDEESWLVYWIELYGDPARQDVWNELDALLNRKYDHEGGSQLHVISAAIDSGGHHAQDVYNFVRRRAPKCFAIKGQSQPGKPVLGKPSLVDITWRGEKIPGGSQLWPVGSDTAKGIIYSRLKISEPGPGCHHWPVGTEDNYFMQLTSEKLLTKYVKGYPRLEWVLPSGKRNEALDCFDSKTEVMTLEGWKWFYELSEHDLLATVNLKTNNIEYQKAVAYIAKPYNGEMIHFHGVRMDILVTPKHRMIASKKKYETVAPGIRHWNFNQPDQIITAEDLTIHHTLKINAKWEGNINQIGKYDQLDLAYFIGWYVSEGFCWSGRSKTQGNKRYRVSICQNKGEKQNKIIDIIHKLGWKCHLSYGRAVVITSKEVYEMVQECGQSAEAKRVPQWIKNAPPNIIEKFLEAAIDGDGWKYGGKYRVYATISSQLAGDVQELFIKIGKSANIRTVSAKPYNIRGRRGTNTVTQYHVYERTIKRLSLDGGGNGRRSFLGVREQYDGIVYCATVPNGTLILRRNGKAFMAGNCEVYNYAAALRAGLVHIDWDKLEESMKAEKQPAETTTGRRAASPRQSNTGWFGR